MKAISALFAMLMVLLCAVAAGALPITYTFSGEVSALYAGRGVDAYQRSADGVFIVDPPVHIAPGYVFSNILIGPSFSGSLTYDPDIAHSLQFRMDFSSGNFAIGKNDLDHGYFPTGVQNGVFTTTAGSAHFDNGQSLESQLLCDPVAYFNVNEMTGLGSVKFDFTDMWNGELTCGIDHFEQEAPVPEPSTLLLLGCGGASLLFIMRRFVTVA